MYEPGQDAGPSPEAAGVAVLAARPRTTVAICTRNRAALLERAVGSVLAQANHNMEILIVDNGSMDETFRLATDLSSVDPRVRIVREPQIGLSIARNRALEQAAGDWIIFFDDDAVAEPGWLAAYEKFFSCPPNSRVMAVGGAVIPQYEIPSSRWICAGEMELGPRPFCFKRGSNPWECNCAYRREAALQAGGFDTRLGHRGDAAGYREGADLNQRLQDAGYEIWWLPDASIRHLVHASRLNLRWQLRAAFNGGRSIAIHRVKDHTPGVRRLYIAGRILVAPFHCAINLFVALTTFPFQNGRVAVKAVLRAASIAGFACELPKQL